MQFLLYILVALSVCHSCLRRRLVDTPRFKSRLGTRAHRLASLVAAHRWYHPQRSTFNNNSKALPSLALLHGPSPDLSPSTVNGRFSPSSPFTSESLQAPAPCIPFPLHASSAPLAARLRKVFGALLFWYDRYDNTFHLDRRAVATLLFVGALCTCASSSLLVVAIPVASFAFCASCIICTLSSTRVFARNSVLPPHFANILTSGNSPHPSLGTSVSRWRPTSTHGRPPWWSPCPTGGMAPLHPFPS